MQNFLSKFKKPNNLFSKSEVLDVDELYDSGNATETVNRFKIINFHRTTNNGPLKARSNGRIVAFVCMVILVITMYFIFTSSYFNYKKGNLKEFQDSFVGVIGLLGMTSFVCLFINFDGNMEIINELDAMFPRTREQQERMNIKEDFKAHLRRWHIKCSLTSTAFILFCTMPILIFILDPNRKNLGFDHYVISSDLPYGLKKDLRTYPIISVIEFYVVAIGLNGYMAYDHMYQTQWYHILMHFKYINYEILHLKLEDTACPTKADRVFKKLSHLLSYHCKVTEIARKCNAVHELSFLLSDMLLPASICTFAYMSTITTDFIRLMRYISTAFVLSFLLYEYMSIGEKCKQVTSETQDCFYNINWPDGSQRMRKDMVKLLQYANQPFVLVCFNLYNIDMVHFQEAMMLSYKMFTFLKSMI